MTSAARGLPPPPDVTQASVTAHARMEPIEPVPTIQVTSVTATGRRFENGNQRIENHVDQNGRMQQIFQSKLPQNAALTGQESVDKLVQPKGKLIPDKSSIQAVRHRMKLDQIGTEIKRCSTPERPYRLHTQEQTSLNPVTKLEPAFHIPVAVAKNALENNNITTLEVSRDNILTALQNAIHATTDQINEDVSKTGIEKRQAKNSILELGTNFRIKNVSIKDPIDAGEFDGLMSKVQKKFNQAENPTFATFWNHLKSNLSNLDNRKRPNLDQVPIRYDKDEILGFLRGLHQKEAAQLKQMDLKTANTLMPLGGSFRTSKKGLEETTVKELMEQSRRSRDESPITRRNSVSAAERGAVNEPMLRAAIDKVKGEQHNYINASFIDSLGLDDQHKAALKKSLKEYYSANDIVANNQFRPEIMTTLKEAAKINPELDPSFAFKLNQEKNPENIHETLGGKLAKHAGMDTYLLPKIEVSLDGAQLKDAKNPSGLASHWIAGDPFPLPLWNQWVDVKHELARAKAEGKDTSAITQKYNDIKQEVYSVGATKSIAKQIFFDAAFFASDSHINQYKKGADGELYNYDFARFFSASPVYVKNANLHVNFRSDLLDHPLADEPLTSDSPFRAELDSVKQQVVSMNVNEIIQKWESDPAILVGTPEFFHHHQTIMSTCEEDTMTMRLNPQLSREELGAIAKKHSVGSMPNASVDEFREAITNKMKEEFRQSQKECWSKAHPKAIQQWKEGMLRMQDYYRTTPTPTLKGAVYAVYPDLAPFLQTMEILDKNPGTSLMIQKTTVRQERAASRASLIRGSTAIPERPSIQRTPAQQAALQSGMEKLGKAKERLLASDFLKGANLDIRPMRPGQFLELIFPQRFYGADVNKLFTVWSENAEIKDNLTTWIGKIEKGEQVPGLDQLKSQNLVKAGGEINCNIVHYMKPEERATRQLSFDPEKQTFSFPNGEKPTTDVKNDQRHIFVLGKDDKFYAAPYERGKVHHSSFFSGNPVQGAGEFTFHNGVLVGMTSKSGHYQPDNFMILNTLKRLEKLGVNLNISFFNVSENKRYANAKQFMKQLEARGDKEVKKLRPLESIIAESKQSGIIPQKQILAMEQRRASLSLSSPNYQEARTGTPGI